MDNQTTTPVGANAHAATTASVLKELVLEFIDPIKNYGYLYFLTIVGLINDAPLVVASVINPPTEQAYDRKDLRTQLTQIKDWCKSSWLHKNYSFEQVFSTKPGRKYYNPISFLALTIALKIAISSIFSLREPPRYEQYCRTSAIMERSLAEQKKIDALTEKELVEALDSLAISDVEQVSRLKRIDQLVAVDYFKKSLPLLSVVLTCLLYAALLRKILNHFTVIELFIAGLYINTLLLILMFWLNSVISFMNKDFSFLGDLNTLFFLAFCPSLFYLRYAKASGYKVRLGKKLLMLLTYGACFVIMNFPFTALVDYIAYLYVGA